MFVIHTANKIPSYLILNLHLSLVLKASSAPTQNMQLPHAHTTYLSVECFHSPLTGVLVLVQISLDSCSQAVV